MTSIFGLPAHPLFAHIPIVLIPLAAIGAVIMLWPRMRDRIGWFVVGIVLVAGLCTQLAISAGQSLEDHVRETRRLEQHIEMGESIRPWVLLMFLALLGVMIVATLAARRAKSRVDSTPATAATSTRGDPLRAAGITLAVLSIGLSAVATYSIVKIGHSGSKAVVGTHPGQDRPGRHHPGRRPRRLNPGCTDPQNAKRPEGSPSGRFAACLES